MRHPETHESRGFGFVTYETVESANKVLGEGEVRVGGAVAKITKAAPKGGKGKGKGDGKGKVSAGPTRRKARSFFFF
jgi:hypothetical protein